MPETFGTIANTCERCGKRDRLQVVETKKGEQQTLLCSSCVSIVVRPNTYWRIKK
jgi:NAD-dependent SIR2 family protein deacetylase